MENTAQNIRNKFQPVTGNELSGTLLRIKNSHENIIIDTTLNIPTEKELGKKLESPDWKILLIQIFTEPVQIFKTEKGYFALLRQDFEHNGTTYQLTIFEPLEEREDFLETATHSLIIACLAGIFISALSGLLFSRGVLSPLRSVIRTVQNIQINNLQERIILPRSHDELYELSDTFNKMLDRLEAGVEQQKRFAADASHELRTPLTVIAGYTSMLERWGKDDPQVLEESLNAIQSETKSMQLLIEKLLQLSRMETGNTVLQKTNTNIDELLTELTNETQLIATQHHIHSELQSACTAPIDTTLIKQMLRIFLENAIKYTPPGGNITISSEMHPYNLHITIKDDGVGIPTENQPHIFKRFYRIEASRSKNMGGTGLGLAIADQIARLHHAKLELHSIPQQGTAITFIMPL